MNYTEKNPSDYQNRKYDMDINQYLGKPVDKRTKAQLELEIIRLNEHNVKLQKKLQNLLPVRVWLKKNFVGKLVNKLKFKYEL